MKFFESAVQRVIVWPWRVIYNWKAMAAKSRRKLKAVFIGEMPNSFQKYAHL